MGMRKLVRAPGVRFVFMPYARIPQRVWTAFEVLRVPLVLGVLGSFGTDFLTPLDGLAIFSGVVGLMIFASLRRYSESQLREFLALWNVLGFARLILTLGFYGIASRGTLYDVMFVFLVHVGSSVRLLGWFSTPETLDAPGAGMPLVQAWMMRTFVLPRLKSDAQALQFCIDLFVRNGKGILKTLEHTTSDQRTQRRLVPRITGLEDSSRYWSINETLEHLMIVGTEIRRGIGELQSGRLPQIKPDTAAVKPKGSAMQDRLEEFKKFLADSQHDMSVISAQGLANSEAKLAHPWFGPMSAHQWFWLLGVHQGIHRRQIREISDLL